MQGTAEISACGRWRFRLTRRWGPGPAVAFVLLNPSVADAERDDPTLRRCIGLARDRGAGGLVVANLFAWRATDPGALRAAGDPVGPGNDAFILDAAQEAGDAICGWGAGGALHGRGERVAAMLREAGVPLWHLGLTKGCQPRHPLYLPAGTLPLRWS